MGDILQLAQIKAIVFDAHYGLGTVPGPAASANASCQRHLFDQGVVQDHNDNRLVRDKPARRSFDGQLQPSDACWLDLCPTWPQFALMSQACAAQRAGHVIFTL